VKYIYEHTEVQSKRRAYIIEVTRGAERRRRKESGDRTREIAGV
jgi:hypothetical protein